MILGHQEEYQKMDHLRCKTPEMVERDIWAHFLSCNLPRKVTCQAALFREVQPRQVSFTSAQQMINAARSQLMLASAKERLRQGALLLNEVGKERVGNRPNRVEPRVVKKRPKPYKRLREPRVQARARLLQKQIR